MISPDDLYADIDQKVADWLEHGARLVVMVNPRRRAVAVHRAGEPVCTLTAGDVLVGDDVVRSWILAVRDLFEEA